MVNWPVHESLDQVNTDAVLMIGDRAMKDHFPGYSRVWDLGEVWREWTGLPFVFAMWVARDKQHGDIAEKALIDARDDGLDHLANISAMEASRYGLSEERCLSYLRDDLRFYLRTPERQALQRFQSYAVQAGLAPGRNELTYHGCEVA
jgi:chorismate dehydratase